jgi:hypothetical protein
MNTTGITGGTPLSSSQNISALSEHSLGITVFVKHTVTTFTHILEIDLHHHENLKNQQGMLLANMDQHCHEFSLTFPYNGLTGFTSHQQCVTE